MIIGPIEVPMVSMKSPSGNMKERIRFQFDFIAEFWDLAPCVQIQIDDHVAWSGSITTKKSTVEFWHELEFNVPHSIVLQRSNKTPDQCRLLEDGSCLDQYVILNGVIIDDINIQNLIWHRSWYEPDYPKQWQQEQEASGVVLETQVVGETWLSHNGTWHFEFTSPFYQFVINQFQQHDLVTQTIN